MNEGGHVAVLGAGAFGTALAVLFLDERVTPAQLAGAACICAGILLVNRAPATPTSV